MQRISISIEDELLDQLDTYIARSGSRNRSEALRDLVRRGLTAEGGHEAKAECVGVLSYTLDPTVRDLGRRIPQSRHENHDRTIAALSVPLDHKTAIEVALMRGDVAAVSAYADKLFLERGVRHGSLALVPVKTTVETHSHGETGEEGAAHSHVNVQESF